MLTIVLLLLAGLAVIAVGRLVIIAFRKRRDTTGEQMELASRICEAAARDAFDIELDYSLESLAKLDELIEGGFASVPEVHEDTRLVLGAYLGQVLVHCCGAKWRAADQEHARATLVFPPSIQSISPFEMVERKLCAPLETSISAEAREFTVRVAA